MRWLLLLYTAHAWNASFWPSTDTDYDLSSCFDASARDGASSLASLRVEHAAVDGARLRVALVADGAAACASYLRVVANASGGEVAPVAVAPRPAGRYAATALLRPGVWQLRAFVEWTGFAADLSWQAARTEGACVPKYLQKDALAEPLVVTVPPYATPAASPCGERAVGGYVAETWAPLGCVLPSEPGVRWLLVAGDSTLQELAVLFVAFLHAETTLACVRRALSDGDWVAVATCPLGGGATFDALLDLNFSAESLRCPRGHDRWRDFDATVRGGLHDAARAPTRGARRFDRGATRPPPLPGRSCEFAAPNATLIWRETSPQYKRFECEGSGGNPGVKVMNAAAAPVARRVGAAVLPAHALRYLRPQDGDGHHCRDGPSCAAQLRFLVALLGR
ncbi:hypothetical protein SO694_00037152 [Aureococcus anophagefferens]|uniref:Uncharacterized protein n=1 Tax=Aureococcus anophagefferens TaxID=44056 RepID=A0ABR1FKW5_AURAN